MKSYSQDLRERVIAALETGEETQAEIAERYGIHESTLDKWWYRWRTTNSCAALPYAGGRRRRLSTDRLETLRQLLIQGAVAQGWENDLWTAKRVADTVQKHFGVDCSPHYAWTILRQYLGWTSQRPIRRVKEGNDAEILRWREQDFPRILRDAIRKEAYLVFIDESGFMFEPVIRRTFAPPGKAPVIKVADPHSRISVAGAITVSPLQKRLGFLYYLLPDNANFHGDSTAQFLSEIYHRISRPIVVLWDGFSIHSSKLVHEYLECHQRITLEEFPAYAPDLNPVDKVWFYLKYDRLFNYTPSTLDELRRRLIQEFVDLQSKPNVLAWCISETGLNLE